MLCGCGRTAPAFHDDLPSAGGPAEQTPTGTERLRMQCLGLPLGDQHIYSNVRANRGPLTLLAI